MAKDNNELCDSMFQSVNLMRSVFMKIARSKKNDIYLLHSNRAVLGVLMRKGPTTMSEIGKSLSISKSNLTPIVDNLVKKGFVKRKQGKSDRRHVKIELTEKGIKNIRNAKGLFMEEFYKVIGKLEKKDRDKLSRAVNDMKEVIAKINLMEKQK
jgi:DNA-binding MarR family transcriptional regulator